MDHVTIPWGTRQIGSLTTLKLYSTEIRSQGFQRRLRWEQAIQRGIPFLDNVVDLRFLSFFYNAGNCVT